jgi:hypothetical protein
LALALTGVGLYFPRVAGGACGGACVSSRAVSGADLKLLIFFCVGMWAFWLSEIGFLFEAVVRIVIVGAERRHFPFGGVRGRGRRGIEAAAVLHTPWASRWMC